MTKVVIYKSAGHITGFEVSGHSGYAEAGSDVVCGVVSTATQMAVVALVDVLKLNAFVEVSSGYLNVKLNRKDAADEKVKVVLSAMELTLRQATKEYDKYVKMEVRKDDKN